MPALDWGDVPSWVGAITTTLALVAAGIAVGMEWRSRRNQEAQDRRAQAAKVAFWPAPPPAAPRLLQVHNGSDLPIFGVVLSIVYANERPGNADELSIASAEVMSPGQNIFVPTDRLDADVGTDLETVRLIFSDSSGLRWERDGLGGLRRIAGPVRDYRAPAHPSIE